MAWRVFQQSQPLATPLPRQRQRQRERTNDRGNYLDGAGREHRARLGGGLHRVGHHAARGARQMSEAIPWLAGGATAVAVAALLVGFTAWLRFLDDEAERYRDDK